MIQEYGDKFALVIFESQTGLTTIIDISYQFHSKITLVETSFKCRNSWEKRFLCFKVKTYFLEQYSERTKKQTKSTDVI